jgi:hypothetical protein
MTMESKQITGYFAEGTEIQLVGLYLRVYKWENLRYIGHFP